MKRTRLHIGFLILLALAGCNSERFPGCCGSTGNRDVPFSETVLFDFKTGAGAITKENPDGNLQIVSAADLLTLLAAAQDTQNLGTGVVSGLVLFNGAPVQDVALKATDSEGRLLAIRAEGRMVGNSLILTDGMVCPPELVSFDNICIKGSIYYNSPGGVPDFSNNKGTAITGTFTIFNLPPGDVYLWASRGGRGTSRIKVFENKISVGKIQVVPIPISTVGITGSVVEAKDESTLVPGATISILGSTDPGLTTVSEGSGLYFISSIGTNGVYLMKVSKPGYWPAYQSLNTSPFQSTSDVPDVTRTVSAFSNAYINEISSFGNALRKPVNPNKGIITGRVRAGDGTPQHCATFTGINGAGVTDMNGDDLIAQGAVVVYVDGPRGGCGNPDSKEQTSTNGLFFIYNLPPGEVFIKYITQPLPPSSGVASAVSGGMIASSLPGVVFVQDMSNSGNGTTQELSGLIVNESNAFVEDAQISILGVTARSYSFDNNGVPASFNLPQAKSDSSGAYVIPKNSDINDRYPLVGGLQYRIKTTKAGRADTYQPVKMSGAVTKQNLLMSSAPALSDPSKGEIHGNVIDRVTGKLAENVTLRATDLDGNLVGGGEMLVPTGIFTISNLPPGLINLSVILGDDSGNGVVRVYPNGITFLEFIIAKVVPAQIKVSGKVNDLNGVPTPQPNLKVLGREDRAPSSGDGGDKLTTDALGNYNGKLESFGQFVIKAEKTAFYDTYNFFPTSGTIDASSSLDLFSISRDQINLFKTTAGISLDPANGILAGTTVKNSLLPNPTAAGIAAGTHSAVLGYFDRDLLVDVVVTNLEAGEVSILFGSGTGSFGPAEDITEYIGNTPSAIAAGNFDENGNLDLVVTNRDDDGITILLGDKNGDFTRQESPLVDDEQVPLDSVDLSLVFDRPIAVAAGLFDADTFLDIAVVNQADVIVLLGNGNGTFHPVYQNSNIIKNSLDLNPTAIVAGDFNQDNRFDMAISNAGSNTISVLLGSTDGTFQPLSDPNTGSPIVIQGVPNPGKMMLLDVNSDGRLDLAVINEVQGKITILIGNISGGFDPLKDANGKVLAPIDAGAGASAMSIGEFNGDNRIDLAVARTSDQTVLILLGNGDGTFAPSTPLPLGGLIGPQQVLLEDTDRNGLFDLIVVGPTGIVTLMGKEEPIGGVSVEARNLEGTTVGTIFYPGGASSTSADGRFIIFNVPPGITLVRNTGQGAGNKMLEIYPDSASYTKVKTLSVQPFLVSVQGVTYDPVGPPPAGVPVGEVNIHLLGMDIKTKSDNATGSYKFDVDANSEYIIRLFFDNSGRSTP